MYEEKIKKVLELLDWCIKIYDNKVLFKQRLSWGTMVLMLDDTGFMFMNHRTNLSMHVDYDMPFMQGSSTVISSSVSSSTGLIDYYYSDYVSTENSKRQSIYSSQSDVDIQYLPEQYDEALVFQQSLVLSNFELHVLLSRPYLEPYLKKDASIGIKHTTFETSIQELDKSITFLKGAYENAISFLDSSRI